MSMSLELLFPPFLEVGVHRPCFDLPAEAFHPMPSDKDSLALAMSACSRCPVQDSCLASGVENGEHGVWGGRVLVNGRPRP